MKLILTGAMFSLAVSAGNVYASSALMREALNKLPGGQITLDVVAGLGAKNSDQMRLIENKLVTKNVSYMQVEGQLDPSIYATGAYVDDNKAQLNAFAFQSMKTGQVKLGAQKAFSSGTALKGELSYSDIETEAINAQAQVTGTPTVTSKFEEADLIFEIQQSLLNNSFGSATRSQLSASEAQGGSVVQQYRLDLGQWMVSTAEIYYNAWFAQRRVEASRHTLEIQKRLLKITKILKNRGVSHQADLLQVEGAVIAAENALREDVNQLNNVWRQLIIYLKLDPAFLKIDPSKIPIVQGDYYKEAKYLCKKSSEKNFLKTSLPRFKKLDLDYKAVKGQLDSSKNLTLPDLNLAWHRYLA